MAIRELNPTPVEVTSQSDPALACYWRRPDDGTERARWITTGQNNASAFMHNARKGMVPLLEYGVFTPSGKARDKNGVIWDSLGERWRLIFQMGGAKEFPASQVIAYRWHIVPPYRGVEFSQIEGMDIEIIECPECDKGVFSQPYDLGQHLRLGHAWTPAELREYGREIGMSFARVRSPRTPRVMDAPADALEELELQEIPRNKEYACKEPGCDWAPVLGRKSPALALSGHRRMKHGVGRKAAVGGGS
jgi:hypothetical protein